jgi:hypothetical protein
MKPRCPQDSFDLTFFDILIELIAVPSVPTVCWRVVLPRSMRWPSLSKAGRFRLWLGTTGLFGFGLYYDEIKGLFKTLVQDKFLK